MEGLVAAVRPQRRVWGQDGEVVLELKGHLLLEKTM